MVQTIVRPSRASCFSKDMHCEQKSLKFSLSVYKATGQRTTSSHSNTALALGKEEGSGLHICTLFIKKGDLRDSLPLFHNEKNVHQTPTTRN